MATCPATLSGNGEHGRQYWQASATTCCKRFFVQRRA
jgi:hypothetical protein